MLTVVLDFHKLNARLPVSFAFSYFSCTQRFSYAARKLNENEFF